MKTAQDILSQSVEDQSENTAPYDTRYDNCRRRVAQAVAAIQRGHGVLVLDDNDRENEGDLIFAAHTLTVQQMAILIRECSGIVCLCLPDAKAEELSLSPMVANNSSKNQTAFTVSIEAAKNVTTGVSAQDRVTTIRTAIAPDAVPADLCRPGHVFPLRAKAGGVLARRGHTEASVDLMKLSSVPPYAVLCELTNPDGTMSNRDEIYRFGQRHQFPVLTVDDIACICSRHGSQSAEAV